MKKGNKKGVSIMIGYILLIAMAIVTGAIVYKWMSTYVPTDPINCPEGASLSIQEVSCGSSSKILNLTLKNNGRFDIGGFFIRISNDSSRQVATKDISGSKISGGQLAQNAIIFPGETNSLEPGETAIATFNLTDYNQVNVLEIIPVRFQTEDKKIKFVNCGEAAVTEKVTCSNISGGGGEEPPIPTFDPLDLQGLVSWYRFEGNINDALGLYNGTCTNCPTNVSGFSGSAYKFDGSNDYIDLGNNFGFDKTAPLSISLWINPLKENTTYSLLSKWDASQKGWEVRMNTYGGNSYQFHQQSSNNDNTKYTISTNDSYLFPTENWYHVTWAWNGTNLKIYVNNSQIGTYIWNSGTPGDITHNTPAKIGYGKSGYFNGTLDEVMIFNRSLNATEISDLYNYFV